MIQALFGFDGPVEMLRSARRAVALETDPALPLLRHRARDPGARATTWRATWTRRSPTSATPRTTTSAPKIIRALSLSTESLVEAERGDLTRSRECAELAMDIIEAEGLRAMPQASLAYTAFGQAQAAAGKTEEALATLDRGLALRRETRGPRSVGHDPPPARHGAGGRGGRPAPPGPRAADRARAPPERVRRRHGRHERPAGDRAAPGPHRGGASRASRSRAGSWTSSGCCRAR